MTNQFSFLSKVWYSSPIKFDFLKLIVLFIKNITNKTRICDYLHQKFESFIYEHKLMQEHGYLPWLWKNENLFVLLKH